MNTLIFTGLHFPVHSQFEIAYLRELALKKITFSIILCDLSASSTEAYQDCEIFDHVKNATSATLSANKVCNMCKKSRIDFFDEFKEFIVLPEEVLTLSCLKNINESIDRVDWASRHNLSLFSSKNEKQSELLDRSILSSLFTRIRASTIEEAQRQLGIEKANKAFTNALKFYLYGFLLGEAISNQITDLRTVVMFNGRFNPFSGIKDSIEHNKRISCVIHERGYQEGTFTVSINEDPGNPFPSISKWFNNPDKFPAIKPLELSQRLDLYAFISRRVTGKSDNGFIYSGTDSNKIDQQNRSKIRFVYFTSCSDEISSYSIDATFERQLEEIKHLASVFQGPQNYSAELVIRCHPNLSTIGRHTPAIDFTNKISNIAKTNNRIKFVGPKITISAKQLLTERSIALAPQSTLNLDLSLMGYRLVHLRTSPYSTIFANQSVVLDDLKTIEDLLNCAYRLPDDHLIWRKIESIVYAFYFRSSLSLSSARIHNRFSEALSPHKDESCEVLASLLKSLSTAQSGLFVI